MSVDMFLPLSRYQQSFFSLLLFFRQQAWLISLQWTLMTSALISLLWPWVLIQLTFEPSSLSVYCWKSIFLLSWWYYQRKKFKNFWRKWYLYLFLTGSVGFFFWEEEPFSASNSDVCEPFGDFEGGGERRNLSMILLRTVISFDMCWKSWWKDRQAY